MSDDKDANKADSANKTPDQAAKQGNPLTAGQAPVKLNHGEKSDAQKQQEEEAKKVSQDPWGETPLQQRDDHSPEVDPASNEPTRGGIDTGRSVRLDPMNPSEPTADGEEPAKGGTTAPA